MAFAAGALLLSTLGAGVAFAAGLAVSPSRLMVFEAPSAVPWTTCTLAQPVADTYVDGAATNALTNFGAQTAMSVRSDAAGNRRAFARFDLSACAIPQTAVIDSATLQAFLQTAPSASRTYEVRSVSAAWTETGLTWVNQPGVAGTPTATSSTGALSGTTLQWDVLADVRAFVAGTASNNGWRLGDASESALSAQEGSFATRESAAASQRPQLVIKYRP